MARRRVARRAALELLYQLDVTHSASSGQAHSTAPAGSGQAEDWTPEDVEKALSRWEIRAPLEPETAEFMRETALGVMAHRADLDALLDRYSHEWTVERMATVDRNILRLAAYEMLYCDDIPASVAINEAVELAKRYGDTHSKTFINGVLAQIKRDREEAASRSADYTDCLSASTPENGLR